MLHENALLVVALVGIAISEDFFKNKVNWIQKKRCMFIGLPNYSLHNMILGLCLKS